MIATPASPSQSAPAIEQVFSDPARGEPRNRNLCDGCGQILPIRPASAETAAGLSVIACPECGHRNILAGREGVLRDSLRHLTVSLMSFWTVLIATSAVAVIACQSVIMVTVLGFLTTHRAVPADLAGALTFKGRAYMLVAKPGYMEYNVVTGALILLSLVLAFMTGAGAATLLRHWRWPARTVFAVMGPALIAAVMIPLWYVIAPHLLAWGSRVIIGLALVQVLGHTFGLLLGSGLMRPLFRIVLPAHVRLIMNVSIDD